MRILVTGANGFIGKNFCVHLQEKKSYTLLKYTRENSFDSLKSLVERSHFIIHLAGENRPKKISDYKNVNTDFTAKLSKLIEQTGRLIPVIFASSIQSDLNSSYGKSKLEAEKILEALHKKTGNPIAIYRLPNVFGKWCKPNYNSVVATFCNNIANNLPILINDKSTNIRLIYIDDLIASFFDYINSNCSGLIRPEISSEYQTNLGELAELLYSFHKSRENLETLDVGSGFNRAMHATYLSYIKPKKFAYNLPSYKDDRGSFLEILKTKNSGQFSFFTAFPGITRGGHYHHTKTEKFLVLKGTALFKFRNIITNETYELIATDNELKVIETIPGWAHNITNTGSEEMIVMLWANEVFDREYPDTISTHV